MAHSYCKLYMHYIFSTKNRTSTIKQEYQKNLWAQIKTIAEKYDIACLSVGGVENHVHILAVLPSTVTVAKGAQVIKGASSKWLNDHYFNDRSFRWQKGYGAFSINQGMIKPTIRYIRNQRIHHQKISYKEEYLSFLSKHEIRYDRRYVFD